MKTQIRVAFVLMLVVISAAQLAQPQVATGTPPFSSYGGGSFDVVNLGNLNVQLTIPIFHKAGRGIPFGFDLAYNSAVWKPVTVGTTTQWSPAANWGWQQKGRVGFINYSVSSQDCQYFVSQVGQTFTAYTQYFYTNWTFTDDSGVVHPLSGSTQTWNGGTQPNTSCSSPPPDVPTASGSATDGSGYTLSISAYTHAVVTTTGGTKVDNSSGTTITDTNGNKITSDISGHFYDTLSSSTPVLTVSGWNFAYTAPGGPANITTVYKSYTVRTNFNVTSPTISEYGPLAASLIDYIQLNDGTKYKFTYETTPGTCTPLSATDPTSCVTARIKSVTLPTGGQISYTYTGGSNGILSDGSTAGLSRVVTPGGTWTYARSGSGSNWSTTVTSPSHPATSGTTTDITSLYFVKDTANNNFYETQRQVYHDSQVSTNLLLTTTTCYNNPSSCPQTSVTSPITQVDSRLQYPNGGLQGRTVTTLTSAGLVTNVTKYQYSTSLPTAVAEITAISYAALGNGITNRLSSVSVSDATAALSSTAYNYDEYSLQGSTGTPQQTAVTGARGNVTSVIRTSAPSTTLTTHVHYYDTGTPYTSTDVNGATATFTYGTGSCGNSFPVQVTAPIASLATSTAWDCTGGVATSTIDANGKTTIYTYNDPNVWRPASVQDPQANITTFTYTPYNASTQALAKVESKLLFNSNSSVVDQLTTIGAYGQPLYTQQSEGPSSANYDTNQVLYDSFLRSYKRSMPCVSTSTTFTDQNLACPSSATTTNTYDALGRVTQTINGSGGYVNYTYTQNDVLQTIGPAPSGESTKQKQLEYDSLGRLTSVCEVTNLANSGACGQTNSANGYKTTYTYDHFVNNGQFVLRTTVTQNAQPGGTPQTRTYLYDQFGRMVQETNPENGATQYIFDTMAASACNAGNAYSSPGDLVKKIDQVGNQTCYTYDSLHRLTDVGTSGPYAAECKRFRYDNTTGVLGAIPSGVSVVNTKGRLVEAETDNCTSPITQSSIITDLWFSYSLRGEVASTWQSTPHSGGYYNASAQYWAHGALQKLMSNITGLPDVSYGVDAAGRPSTVTAASH